MDKERDTEQLIAKYLLGIITQAEKKELDQWIQQSSHHKDCFNRLLTDTSFRERYQSYSKINSTDAWKRFQKEYSKSRLIHFKTIIKYAAILALPIFMLGGWHYYTSIFPKEQVVSCLETGDTIQPGIPQATLFLSKNQKESLTDTTLTRVKIGNSVTATSQKGTLIYPASTRNDEKNTESTEDNTLVTDLGNEFNVTFEDGTTVHLNYNTELKYPVKFSSKQRTVYLKGEAYFKVAKDSRPFYVVTEAGTIKQYGTEFNVNTFTPDQTEVALVKGSISITSSSKSKEQFIKPGQLALSNKKHDEVSIYDVDITPYVAWNDGRLIFENRSLESITEILEHWYKVKISFGSPELKRLHFTGNMDRYGTITPILKAIARTTNLDIQIEGREIVISNN